VEELHERRRTWEREWPFRSTPELVRASERLVKLVDEAAGEPVLSVELGYPTGKRRTGNLDDFATAASELDLGAAESFEVGATHEAEGRQLEATLIGYRGVLGPATVMVVRGTRATAVAGVASQVEDMVVAFFSVIDREAADAAAAREAEAARESARAEAEATAPDKRPAAARSQAQETGSKAAVIAVPTAESGSTESGTPWYHHPWTVTIVGGVVAAVVAAVLLALIIGL
jgi:hypothetical protein